MGAVVGIVLGAGASTRMGRPKQTLAFGEGTLLAHVVADVEASRLDRVVLVLGGDATDAASSVRPRRTEIVRNDAYGTGCASSLRAGLEAAGDCDAVILLLGDMPGVTAAVIDPVLSGWRGSPRLPGGSATAVHFLGVNVDPIVPAPARDRSGAPKLRSITPSRGAQGRGVLPPVAVHLDRSTRRRTRA